MNGSTITPWGDGKRSNSPVRHTFATYFMKNGGDIITLRGILRHTTLAMTERYAHFAHDRMAKVPGRSPLAKL